MTPSAGHPDESLIEYCRDGLLNADGDVRCMSDEPQPEPEPEPEPGVLRGLLRPEP